MKRLKNLYPKVDLQLYVIKVVNFLTAICILVIIAFFIVYSVFKLFGLM